MTHWAFLPRWLLASLALLAVEIAIARYAPPGVLRGFGGDVLVVVLVYAVLRTFVAQPAARLAQCALLFACAIEGLQALGMVDALGLHRQTALHRGLRIALGATFDVWDLVAYGCGWLVCRWGLLFRTAPKRRGRGRGRSNYSAEFEGLNQPSNSVNVVPGQRPVARLLS